MPAGHIYAAGQFTNDSLYYYVAKYSLPATGIKSTDGVYAMQVYQNPDTSRLNLVFDKNITGAAIKLTDITGKTLLLDLEGLANGLYFISLDTGGYQITTKVQKVN
ncbi:MAG TPA: T9SS type A sorting domain-containing protein [Chitinophagales bacterium]|nr:T9SS type A sorting domain-containing protein [Chitinophagales bacterium]